MALFQCCSNFVGPLWIQSTMYLYISFHVEQFDDFMKLEAKRAYNNYNQDCRLSREYDTTYENYMYRIIDYLVELQTDTNMTDKPLDGDITDLAIVKTGNQPIHNLQHDVIAQKSLARDINDPNKTKGYIATESTDYEFIGPDRATVSITNVSHHLKVTGIIRSSGFPNYRQA